MKVMRHLLIWPSGLLLLNACSSKPKIATPFSNGYDKITVARADVAGGEGETIKPEFISEIRKTSDVFTVLEIYQAKGGQANALSDQIVSGLRQMSGKVPGLVSFNVLRGAGNRVINYAQFENKAAFDSWKSGATYKQHRESVKALVKGIEDERFDVVYIQQ